MQEQTRPLGRSSAKSAWTWFAVVVLLLGGTFAQQLIRWDRPPNQAVLVAVGFGLLAIGVVEIGRFVQGRQFDARTAVLQSDSTEVVMLVRDGQVTAAIGGATSYALGIDPKLAVGLLIEEVIRTTEPNRLKDVFAHALGQRDRGARSTGLVLDAPRQQGGEYRYVDVAVRDRNHDRAIRAFVVTVSDATDRVAAQQHLARTASIDQETALPNRERLVEFLDMVLHRARRKGDHVAILTVGIDRHASLVEGFDEASRTAIMAEVARRIRATVRLEDPVGRIAVDQFGVLLGGLEPKIGRAFALDIADRIAQTVSEPMEVGGSRLSLAVSVGASHRSQGGAEPTASELLVDAQDSLEQVRANTNRWKDSTPA